MDTERLEKKIKLTCIELDLTQTQLAEKINAKEKKETLGMKLEHRYHL